MSEPKLKPCPFCGGEALSFQTYDGWWVRCKPCSWYGRSMIEMHSRSSADDAAERWNRRIEPVRGGEGR